MATEHIIVGTDDTQADSAAILAPDLHRQAAPDAALAKTFHAHRRGPFGSKHIFTEAEGPGRYWVFNPVPQKHASTWKPVLWRGTTPNPPGDGMQEVLLNDQRRAKKRAYERGQKMRRWFRMKPTPPKNPLEEEKVVTDLVMSLTMKRPKGMGRSLKWSLGGEQYTWKGTRQFLPARVKGWRGISHDFKLVDSHGAIIATYEKDRWASFKRAEKVGAPPNKRRKFLGTLTTFLPSQPNPVSAAARAVDTTTVVAKDGGSTEHLNQSNEESLITQEPKKKKAEKPDKILNLDGPHSGDLLEEAVVFTCWMAFEGEHRLRWKILDLLEEVAETLGE
ncbi:unnamed protein product [Parascedosporium putredinis]|uniref:Uncharacterized protein n=1 Tax=Parascedosporium putredinis TaxID=1442378 RepID=A0A9P1H070_9PEZI|nr:unnamed protein product [Parascedosporium putredinis]CAI7993590.1 unnamed protein product [Parascedosporium putredinis]